MKFWIPVAVICSFCLSIAAFVQLGFVTKHYNPEGYESYLYEEPRLYGDGGFIATLQEGSSFGPTLRRIRRVSIETRPQAFDETIAIPAGTGTIEMRCSVIARPAPGRVKEIVESYGGENWYRGHVRPSLIEALQQTTEEHAGDLVFEAGPQQFSAFALDNLSSALAAWGAPFVIEKLQVREMRLPPGFRVTPREESHMPRMAGVNASSDSESAPAEQQQPAELPPTTDRIEISHKREFRGVWLATASNIDWPSKEGMPVAQQQEELIEILDALKEMRMNALVLQVRGACDALYQSQYEPWSKWLTGEQGVEPEPFYDPLAFAIEECHRRNIELHAWINPFRAHTTDKYKLAPNHIANVLCEHCYVYGGGNQTWMDPGAKPVQDWIVRVISDLTRRYDIDGVHMDDYFYPYPDSGKPFPDGDSYDRYLKDVGHLELGDWRRQNVNTLIYRVSQEIRKVKPHVKFGVSPFGLYRPGEPKGTRGLDQYAQIFSDPKQWLDNGWIDYISPQLYWKNSSNRSYTKLLEWWSTNNPLRRHIYAGNSLLQIGTKTSELTTQVNASRSAREQQSLGNLFFGWKFLRTKRARGVRNHFQEKLFIAPALPPAMPWLATALPECPKDLKQDGDAIVWKTPESEAGIRGWTLYSQKDDTSWELQQIIPASESRLQVEPGAYALCAVDQVAQESVGVVVTVENDPNVARRNDNEELEILEPLEAN